MSITIIGMLKKLWIKLGTYRMDVVFLIANTLLWLNMDKVLLSLDPTSAVPSGEYLAKFIFAIFGLFTTHTIVKIIMAFGWVDLDHSLEQNFNTTYNRLDSWQKIKTSLFVFSLYFLAFVLLVMAM